MSALKAQLAETDEDHDLNVFSVFFAMDRSGKTEEAFHIQGALRPEFDEQDKRLGHDTYCLCCEPGQVTHYGGVESWEMVPGVVKFRFTEKAATDLGLDRELTIEFPVEKSDEIRRGLARVLDTRLPVGTASGRT